jgi:putative endopeptidase
MVWAGLAVGMAGVAVPGHAAGGAKAGVSSGVPVKPVEPKGMHSFDVSSMDKTADPCTNFYQYTCGNWKKHNPIPADEPAWGSFGILDVRNQYLLYTELKTAAAAAKSGTAKPLEAQYGTYFAACMDTDAINAKGAKPVQASLDAIAALKDKRAIGALLGDTRYDVGGFVGFGPEPDQKDSTHWIASVQQGGLTLPDRDYYLSADAHMVDVRAKYHDYIVKLMQLAGETPAQAQTTATAVLRIETALAKASMTREAMRDPDAIYHPMPVTQLEQMAPGFDWTAYFRAQKSPAFTRVDVSQPEFMKAMSGLIETEPLDALKQYMAFQTVNGMARQLSQPFDTAHFDFFGKVLNGQAEEEARWKRCTAGTDNALGEAVGQGWVKANFPPQAKQDMQQLVKNLETAMHADIADVSWMSDATKQQAELKLSEFRDKIGYPDKWRSYAGVKVEPGDWYGDAHRAAIFNNTYYLDKIGGTVDESEWGMTPPTVNAYYNPAENDINFPAGILQPPFYQFGMDPGVNYGSIGAVIGHEMTHGFDDEGSRFDGKGNKRDWFTAEDRKKFNARTDCEVKEYGSFSPLPGKTLNGKLTLGENTADNGGIRIAYQALQTVLDAEPAAVREKKTDGYTEDQRFFIAFGQVWCENVSPAMELQLLTADPHSPGEFRTNGVVRNFPAFGKAFGCKVGQPMMPVNSCRVW